MEVRLLTLLLSLWAACGLPSAAMGQTGESPTDLLTLAEGAVVLSASVNASAALALTDGDAKTAWNSGGPKYPGPYVFVFELRAPTLLSHVGIDNSGPRPGGVAGAAVRRVLVEGSSESPEAGYVALGTIEAAEDGETLIAVTAAEPLRWLRFTVESTQSSEAKWAYFDEVIAQGTQTPPEGERFTGVFETGRNATIELHQSGAQISGCFVEDGGHSLGEVTGDVVDGVARLRWQRTDKTKVHGVALLVVDSRGHLNGVRYRDKSRTAWGGPPAPEGTTTPCSAETPPANPIAEALAEEGSVRLYGILFDFGPGDLEARFRAGAPAAADSAASDAGVEGGDRRPHGLRRRGRLQPRALATPRRERRGLAGRARHRRSPARSGRQGRERAGRRQQDRRRARAQPPGRGAETVAEADEREI
jgi:hypothetical protein